MEQPPTVAVHFYHVTVNLLVHLHSFLIHQKVKFNESFIMRSKCLTLLYFVRVLSQSQGISVVGTVDEDTTFYYRELTTEPSLLGTVEYTVIYNRSVVSTSSSIMIYTV